MMRTYARGVTVFAAVTVLAACGGGGEGTDLAEAFCSDLGAGMPVSQIIMSAGDSFEFDDTRDAAARVGVWVADGCPEQFETNAGLVDFLDANGFAPADFDE
jgi:hypothetical protein